MQKKKSFLEDLLTVLQTLRKIAICFFLWNTI